MPQHCPFCGRTIGGEQVVCEDCSNEAENNLIAREFTLDMGEKTLYFSCMALGFYQGELRKSLQKFKFGGKTVYANGLGLMMAKAAMEFSDGFDIISYVPMTKKRQKERGYNQAALLAEEIARNLGCEQDELLEKLSETQVQHTLKLEERHENVKAVFAASERCRDKRILLVDDIVTTGSTICSCAKELYSHGAKNVYGICAASSG